MAEQLDEALLDECAEWISTMLEEEDGAMVDAGLVSIILERERDLRAEALSPQPHIEMARLLAEALDAEGVRGMPDVVAPQLILLVLGWEDEFLALAGRPRPPL